MSASNTRGSAARVSELNERLVYQAYSIAIETRRGACRASTVEDGNGHIRGYNHT